MKRVKIKENFINERKEVKKGQKLFDLEILSFHFNTWHEKIVPIYAEKSGILSLKKLSEKNYTEFKNEYNNKKIIESLISIKNKNNIAINGNISQNQQHLTSQPKGENILDLKTLLTSNSYEEHLKDFKEFESLKTLLESNEYKTLLNEKKKIENLKTLLKRNEYEALFEKRKIEKIKTFIKSNNYMKLLKEKKEIEKIQTFIKSNNYMELLKEKKNIENLKTLLKRNEYEALFEKRKIEKIKTFIKSNNYMELLKEKKKIESLKTYLESNENETLLKESSKIIKVKNLLLHEKKEIEKIKTFIKSNNYMDLLQEKKNIEKIISDIENNKSEIQKKSKQESKEIIQKNKVISSKKTFYKKLDDLIGLIEVKGKVTELIDLTKIQAERQKIGLKNMTTNKNMIFQGPPGTCKTTVARIIGEIFHSLGLLSKKKFVEVDKCSLVAEYVGQTAVKTMEVIEKAKGGVLFIDEAYSLLDCDYGKESITTILKFMEDNREDLVVIIAGYKEPMQKFINSNPGLKSRFSNLIDFPHYSQQELVEIFKYQSKLNNYKLSENALIQLNPVVANIYKSKDDNFGNGRSMRNLFDISIKKHASRLINQKKKTNFRGSPKKLSLEDLSTLRGVDIQLSKEEIKYVA